MTSKITQKGEKIRNFIISLFENKTELKFNEISPKVEKKFGITQNTVRKHLQNMFEQNAIDKEPNSGRGVVFRLPTPTFHSFEYDVNQPYLNESTVWVKDFWPLLNTQGEGCKDILTNSFTEIFNNAIDHAKANKIIVNLSVDALYTTIVVIDDGIGIFKKIKEDLNLADEHLSLIELSKGKFTSDPQNHSGEGVYFASMACDYFLIASNNLKYTRNLQEPLGLLEDLDMSHQGTTVIMRVKNNTSNNCKKVYDKFSSIEGGFYKTKVPVRLLRYQDEGIVSRSQAKRLLARFNMFKVVELDFEGIDMIGQAFTDEIFRVFKHNHPDIDIQVINATKDVLDMINRINNNIVG